MHVPVPITVLLCSLTAAVALAQPQSPTEHKPYRLPAVDLKQRIIWGSECIVNDDLGLAFGGVDQEGEGTGTRIRIKGTWERVSVRRPIDLDDSLRPLARHMGKLNSQLRRSYLEHDQHGARQLELFKDAQILQAMSRSLAKDVRNVGQHRDDPQHINKEAERLMNEANASLHTLTIKIVEVGATPEMMTTLSEAKLFVEQTAEMLAIAPPPRALSPIVYDEKTNLFFLFGGDHLDYLINDTWVFDPKLKAWELRLPESAPQPRANHTLKAAGDGKITLSGGYTYASNTDYMGGQYVDIGDTDWTYDIAKNEWATALKTCKGVSPLTRTYRIGKFHPDYFLQGPRPDRVKQQEVLAALPVNEWVSLKPPHLPEMNRDWGTAVLDPDRDLILRWSGGHSAHSGSDVLHYHIATNRWELPFPVEFPLGQCYTNTEFPEGVNFNGRPWVTGHTYQNYGYDPNLKKLLFTGRAKKCFVWDPDIADWSGPGLAKPPGMSYDSCFYTLTCTPTPQGLVCWTNEGRLFQFDATSKQWNERKLSGEKLPGSVVDNSTIVYDSKRKRLLAVLKAYGEKANFSGDLHAIDCNTWAVSRIEPAGRAAAAAIPYLCQLRYDVQNDQLLVGGTLPPDDSGLRRTPAYDCANNRWISLKITGDDPSGIKGRNVSLGLMYDAKRSLFLATDTKSNVFALKLDVSKADARDFK